MKSKLRTGDLLYRSKGLVEHAAVYIGNELVCHCSPTNDVEIITVDEYSEGKTVGVIHTDIENKDLLQHRLKQILAANKTYSVFANNCEHIASYLIHGRRESRQLQTTLMCSLLGAVVSRNASLRDQLLMILLFSILGCAISNATREYDEKI